MIPITHNANHHKKLNTLESKTYVVKTISKKVIADTLTPVGIYLKLRDKYPQTILLESSDYRGNENSYSFICFDVKASIKIENNILDYINPDNDIQRFSLKEKDVLNKLNEILQSFSIAEDSKSKLNTNGFYGYTSYDSIQFFEDIKFKIDSGEKSIPLLYYNLYKYVIAINHFNDEMTIFEHHFSEEDKLADTEIDEIEAILKNRNTAEFSFTIENSEQSNCTDQDFLTMVKRAKEHCKQGDVFQMVLSREFTQKFKGDDFNVYRALRSVNPSPYLFYFDFGSFKLIGSSPEAQIVIRNNHATVFPIAGTFRRTGNDAIDAELAESLKNDPKETSEHIMLVDLARNDLSKNCKNVKVESFKEIQYYSHVIHLVSKVTGNVIDKTDALKIAFESYPAGTLSGAPKHKAMKLIDSYENNSRSYYGGCIGFMGFNGDFNHAIIIRSFLSKDNKLHYRAGAGIVIDSIPESELQEVNNKLAALKKAIVMAEKLVN